MNIKVDQGTDVDVATDDIGGVKHQVVLLEWGPVGTANRTDIASGKPLPVQVRKSDGTADVVATESTLGDILTELTAPDSGQQS